MKSPRLLVAAFALVAVAASACTTHAGAAAQVDDATISASDVRDIVDRGMDAYNTYAAANPDVIASMTAQGQSPLTRDVVQRRTLANFVELRLDERIAAGLGVTITEQEVDEFYQALAVSQAGSVPAFERAVASIGYSPEDARRAIRSDALESKIEDKIAPELLATDAQARDDYDALVATFKTVPLSYAQMVHFLRRSDQNIFSQRFAKLQPLLTAESKTAGVSVNPRFGVWSADDLQVLAQSGSIATSATPLATLNLG